MPQESPKDDSATPTVDVEEPPTLETVLQWLQSIRPAAMLALLRHPDAALISVRAFAGFRVNAQGYANPLVRSRLAQEILRDSQFRERVEALVALPPVLEADRVAAMEQDEPLAIPSTSRLTERLTEQLQQEREERKRDRSQARAGVEEIREALAQANRDLAATRQALDEVEQVRAVLRQAAERSAQRLSRLERQNTSLRVERDVLLKERIRQEALRTTKDENANGKVPKKTPPPATGNIPPSPFETAIYRIQQRGDIETAIIVVEDVLKVEPNNIAALEIAANAYRQSGRLDQAQTAARDLVSVSLAQGDLKKATDTLVALLAADPGTPLLDTVSRPYISALLATDVESLARITSIFGRLRTVNSAAYSRISALIAEHGNTALVSRVLSPAGVLVPTDPLPFGWSIPVTANALIAAIDASDVDLVHSARKAIDALRRSGASEYEQTTTAITLAAGSDDPYVGIILRHVRGPIIVDASNVAWYEENTGAADRPRLDSILRVRRTLRLAGYFPIYLIGDAPLPFTIDSRERFREMMSRHEISLVVTGTDADEFLLREARRLHAPIVTNDYMADWDPDNEVDKIRYAIPPTGTAYLL